MALTATATPNVREDIVRLLKLKNPRITVASFDRYKIHFRINLKTQLVVWLAGEDQCYPGPSRYTSKN
jgi:superfamily II DNA helicase RecQ